jgi:hypothetical protein
MHRNGGYIDHRDDTSLRPYILISIYNGTATA